MDEAGDGLDQQVGRAEVVREVFDALPLMAIALDGPDQRIVAANSAYHRGVGRSRLVGLRLLDAMPELQGQRAYELLRQVYDTGTARSGREWRSQLDITGTGQVENRYFDFTAAPRRDTGGKIVGVTLFAFDVTERVRERQRAEQRVLEAEERYQQAREVISRLQRDLLPLGLPVLPSARIAASYLLADDGDTAGGDWFDAVPLPGGRVALTVGDVAGHGVAASATMGQLRAVLRHRLEETEDLTEALTSVDRMAHRLPGARATTVCVAVLDPADGTLAYCTAGHPPPLVIDGDSLRYLEPTGAGPLGTGSSFTASADRVAPGGVVLLYSDGILERPGRVPADASVELAQVASDAVAGRALRIPGQSAAERACTHPVELLVRQTGHTDDITLLAAQRGEPVPPLHLRLPAHVGSIRPARHDFTHWLDEHDVGAQDAYALVHAVNELVSNAAEHSHRGTPGGHLVLTAALDAEGFLQAEVTDDGRWIDRTESPGRPATASRGLGLTLARNLVDELTISHGDHGTTATVHHRLSTPAQLLNFDGSTAGTPRPDAGPPELMLVIEQDEAPSPRIAVHGPLDAVNAGAFAQEIQRRTFAGTHPLTVDLTAVTHLASAAVAVLHRSVAGHRTALRLYAPAGSVAHQVLVLVNLPHTTTDPDAG